VTLPDLSARLAAEMPALRGRLMGNVRLADLTWFRVGGPAEVLFSPADAADLAYFLSRLPASIPTFVLGLGSNLLVRDGGVPGVVIRLGRGFAHTQVEADAHIRVGAAVPDVKLARAAADAAIAGLAFYRGIPGSIGGALRMNAGAHGRETRDVIRAANAVDRQGRQHVLAAADLNLSYRHCGVPDDWIFTEALYQGCPGSSAEILQEMAEVADYREAHQPIKERTGGSTFKNPTAARAWQLIDQAGCRGLSVGGAKVSEMHCNFLINGGAATAEDIERLGETVRARVLAACGVTLHWEIIRQGRPSEGRSIGEALAKALAP
jgi:UDP-N-acetylmuramate dehydrogenase